MAAARRSSGRPFASDAWRRRFRPSHAVVVSCPSITAVYASAIASDCPGYQIHSHSTPRAHSFAGSNPFERTARRVLMESAVSTPARFAARAETVVRLRAVPGTFRQPSELDPSPNEKHIASIANGDHAAMAHLYDATQASVFALALRIVEDRAAAEDVVIEVYSQCWRQARSFDRNRGTVISWLMNMTRSRALDSVRARRRRVATIPIDEEARGIGSADPGPAESSLASERGVIVRSALTALSAAQREAIELAFFSDLSHSAIAARLGLPLGTIKTRIRDGMIKMRELLAPIAETDEKHRA